MSNRGGKTYRPWEPQYYRQELHSPERLFEKSGHERFQLM